jgi:stearoyl-CoA desaturase (delta-9 desaturase)
MNKGHMNLLAVVLVHAACFAASWTGVSAFALGLAVLSFGIRMFGITAGYHRYFAHRSFKAGRGMQFVLAWLGCSAAQKGPLWWAAHHRTHHQVADQRGDIHSPIRETFFWSHMGWWMSNKYDETQYKLIPDYANVPELRWLNKYFLVPPVVWAFLCAAMGGWQGVVWGFFISTTFLWHATFLINSAAHLVGRRRYPTLDGSRNSFWLAILTLGEGWHNNHHYFPSSVNQGFYWWEIDVSYYTLRVLEKIGLVSDLRRPPERVLAKGRADSLKIFPKSNIARYANLV